MPRPQTWLVFVLLRLVGYWNPVTKSQALVDIVCACVGMTGASWRLKLACREHQSRPREFKTALLSTLS